MNNEENNNENLRPFLLVSLIGYSNSGKTTSIEKMIEFLKEKGYFLIVLKHTDKEDFSIDTKGKNTWRYTQAGANIVNIHSKLESTIIFNIDFTEFNIIDLITYLLSWSQLKKKKKNVIVLCEGFREIKENHILCVDKIEDIENQINEYTIGIAGKICNKANLVKIIQEKYSLPIINILKFPEKVYDLFKNT